MAIVGTVALSEIVTNADNFTDEEAEQSWALSYANDCISTINAEVGLLLPFVVRTDYNKPYTALDSTWFVNLLNMWLSWGIKMNDGSLSEADRYYQEFLRRLDRFKKVAIGSGDDGSGGVVDVAYINQDLLSKKWAQRNVNKFSAKGTFGWFGGDPNSGN